MYLVTSGEIEAAFRMQIIIYTYNTNSMYSKDIELMTGIMTEINNRKRLEYDLKDICKTTYMLFQDRNYHIASEDIYEKQSPCIAWIISVSEYYYDISQLASLPYIYIYMLAGCNAYDYRLSIARYFFSVVYKGIIGMQ